MKFVPDHAANGTYKNRQIISNKLYKDCISITYTYVVFMRYLVAEIKHEDADLSIKISAFHQQQIIQNFELPDLEISSHYVYISKAVNDNDEQ